MTDDTNKSIDAQRLREFLAENHFEGAIRDLEADIVPHTQREILRISLELHEWVRETIADGAHAGGLAGILMGQSMEMLYALGLDRSAIEEFIAQIWTQIVDNKQNRERLRAAVEKHRGR